MMDSLKRISAALGLLAATAAAPALAQGVAPSRNQAIADQVAGALRSNLWLSGSRIDIEAREGIVTLSGVTASPAVKAQALARTQRVPGVIAVVDRLRVAQDARVRPAQFQPTPIPATERQPTQVALGHFHHGPAAPIEGPIEMGPAAPIEAAPAVAGPVAPAYEGPIPEGPAAAGPAQPVAPGYPNYAWPTYAPYPNFSAVGYPTVYPWQAWPNIGPFYPYPEVPLDWRAVTLRWADGLWWLDFKKNYTRPFFTPYPFGLFAY